MLQLSTHFATELVGQLAHAEPLKTAIRDAGGLLALVRHLKVSGNSTLFEISKKTLMRPLGWQRHHVPMNRSAD